MRNAEKSRPLVEQAAAARVRQTLVATIAVISYVSMKRVFVMLLSTSASSSAMAAKLI
jgi:hypothetical protein